ncbi:hypothetical protein TNCV_1275071 [Trichonephila clavipes]|nr:hypothetical protein TNCV_1275071 [Trichonephila clavipes]
MIIKEWTLLTSRTIGQSGAKYGVVVQYGEEVEFERPNFIRLSRVSESQNNYNLVCILRGEASHVKSVEAENTYFEAWRVSSVVVF